MAFIDVAAAVGTAVGADALGAAGATIVGGGILGAGAGALYGGLSGGNIGQDALMGGLLGAGGGALGGPGDPTQYSGIANMFGAGPAATTYETVTPTTPATSTIPADLRTQLNPEAWNTNVSNLTSYTPTTQELNPNAWGSEVGTNAANAASAQNFVPGSAATAGANPASDSLWSGLSKGQKYMVGGAGIALGANLLGLNRPTTFDTPTQSTPANTGYFKLNPATFQPNRPQPVTGPIKPGVTPPYPNYVQNPYQPTGYASGGIAGYKDSNYSDLKNKQDELQYFESMISPQQSSSQDPSWVKDVGIVTDTDPNTRNLSPLEAARYQRAKLMAAAGMPTSAGVGLTQQTAPYGTINTDPYMVQQAQQTQNAASGGIMGYSLGGYAHGGNPRLLRGPGDGMSDDIPATIGERQPARLADGEFVVPADVVSHLGNGSTEAGAEKLHSMMDKVRVAKTGKKKQAPQLKTDKFIPS